MNRKKLRWSRRLSFVPRWSVLPVTREQKVDQHCYHVTQITRYLLALHDQGHDTTFCLETLEYALDHDENEAAFGDSPSTSKPRKDYEALAREKGQIYIIVKAADLIESMMFLSEQVMMGNSMGMAQVIGNTYEELLEVEQFFDFVPTKKGLDLWEEVGGAVFDRSRFHPSLEALA